MSNGLTLPSNGFEAMLEAFFCVQPTEHMKAWRWHLYTKNFNADAVDAALRDGLRELRNAKLPV